MKTTNLLGQLASLTSVRDLELLELSLLKTLKELLTHSSIKLLNISRPEGGYLLRGYVHDGAREDLKEYLEEGVLTDPQPDSLPASLFAAIARANWSGRPASDFQADGFTTVYPLLSKEMVFGYVLVTGKERPKPHETPLIEGILRVFYNYYTLLRDSQKDKLTGLLNRKTFDERIDKIIEVIAAQPETVTVNERRRHDSAVSASFWLAVVDVDHFKRINDTFGHLYGDEVLLLLSQMMKRSFRRSDLLFRFGGEEFVIVIAAPDRISAHKAFENFRQTVESHYFPQISQVTISLGATRIGNRFIPSELVGRADQALYHAKRNGRNRLFFYEDLVAEGAIQTQIQQGSIELF